MSTTMTIKEIVETWPETLDVFIANGFENLKDQKMLENVGRFLKLESALINKGYAIDTFVQLLEDKINENDQQVDITLVEKKDEGFDIDVAGLLPCPVRVPLLEAFNTCTNDYQQRSGLKTRSRLEAASFGADWINENIRSLSSAEELPDLFISAGFDTFFDSQGIGKYQQQGDFEAVTPDGVNADFSAVQISDPQQAYSIISVVPAVFMVDLLELGDLPVPRTWEDLLKPIYAKRVALPVGDFDLFNAILLNIHKEFGDDGVKRLGRSMLQSLHPAQMVKTAGRVQEQKPLITIMPYFFTRMAGAIPSVEIVWPQDGAIISPIFLLTKKDSLDKTRELAEFLAGPEVGEILAQKGLFPSLNPQVKNVLPDCFPDAPPWKWLGWDTIYNNDIAELIKQTDALFSAAVNEGQGECNS
ncbi:MAG: ABC transporter substrate-binding protein [Desulfuromonas sp.]|nr:ABC transporter substrate-binding protein [Desulfuromonas sp.]